MNDHAETIQRAFALCEALTNDSALEDMAELFDDVVRLQDRMRDALQVRCALRAAIYRSEVQR